MFCDAQAEDAGLDQPADIAQRNATLEPTGATSGGVWYLKVEVLQRRDRDDETGRCCILPRPTCNRRQIQPIRYCAMKPPSITSSVPVTNEASSDARNSTP